jgi:hypothetical protein
MAARPVGLAAVIIPAVRVAGVPVLVVAIGIIAAGVVATAPVATGVVAAPTSRAVPRWRAVPALVTPVVTIPSARARIGALERSRWRVAAFGGSRIRRGWARARWLATRQDHRDNDAEEHEDESGAAHARAEESCVLLRLVRMLEIGGGIVGRMLVVLVIERDRDDIRRPAVHPEEHFAVEEEFVG